MSASKQTFLAFLGFAILTIVLFMPWWWFGKVCAPLDIITNLYEPWADMEAPAQVRNPYPTDAPEHYLLRHHHAWLSYQREGRLGWNYLEACGTPAYANTMAAYADWTFLFYRIFSFWTGWHLGLMSHLLIALMGMFLFLKGFGYKTSLSTLGSVAFALSSHFSAWTYHRWALGSMCWLPLIAWSFYRLRDGSKWGLLAPVLLALGFMGGHLQYAGFLIVLVALIWLGWLVETRCIRRSTRELAFFSLAGLLAIGLAAVMLVPFSYAFVNTMRFGLVRGGLGYPSGRLSPLFNILAYPSLIFPYIGGSPRTLDAFKVFRLDLWNVPFFGSLLVVLAFLGLFMGKLNKTARLIAAFGLVLPLTPLVETLYHRLLVFFIFGGVWLAIDAMHNIGESEWRRIRSFVQALFIVGSLILLGVSLALIFYERQIFDLLWSAVLSAIDGHRFAADLDYFAGRTRLFIFNSRIWHPRILSAWVLFGISLFLMRYRQKQFFGWALLIVVAGQLLVYRHDWVVFSRPFGPERAIYPMTEEISAIQQRVGNPGRVHVVHSPDRLPLFPLNSLSYFKVPHVAVYDSILPNGIQKGVPNILASRDLPIDARFLGDRAVTHLITFREMDHPGEGWILLTTKGKIALYTNTFAEAWYQVKTEAGVVPATPELHSHNRRMINLPRGASGISLRENWDEGWQYRLADEPWRYMQLAEDRSMFAGFAPLPEQTAFEMRYRPRALSIGRVISVFSLLLYVLLAAWHLIKPGVGRP